MSSFEVISIIYMAITAVMQAWTVHIALYPDYWETRRNENKPPTPKDDGSVPPDKDKHQT